MEGEDPVWEVNLMNKCAITRAKPPPILEIFARWGLAAAMEMRMPQELVWALVNESG